MDPEIKSSINRLATKLNAQAESYETQLTEPSDDILGGLQGTIDRLSGTEASGTGPLSDLIGATLESGAFGDTSTDIARTVLPDFLGGAAEGFMGHWLTIIVVFLILLILRMVFISFVGSIDYRGIISLGRPGGLKYILIAIGFFGLAGYYSLSLEEAKNGPPRHLSSTYSTHFR